MVGCTPSQCVWGHEKLVQVVMIFPSKYGKYLFNLPFSLGGLFGCGVNRASKHLSYIIISCGVSMVPMSPNAILHSWFTSHRTRSESNFSIDTRCIAEKSASNLFPSPPTGTSVRQLLVLWISIFIL